MYPVAVLKNRVCMLTKLEPVNIQQSVIVSVDCIIDQLLVAYNLSVMTYKRNLLLRAFRYL